MSLGPKRSEEPFSPNDLRLLGSVATQTGLALENSRLTLQVGAEIAEREKQRRELEIAREVQERLFPQSYPSVPGLEFAGFCRPAHAIGGDYYDFVPLEGGRLGLAIGDISGKGIPAALLMATLRAFLRGQTVREPRRARADDVRPQRPRVRELGVEPVRHVLLRRVRPGDAAPRLRECRAQCAGRVARRPCGHARSGAPRYRAAR